MTGPIRVLQIIGIVCGGGVEAVIMNYYRHIDRTKVQFDFVVDGYDECLLEKEINALGGKVYKTEPYKKNVFKNMFQIYKIIKDNNYTIVHSNMNTLSVFSLFAAKIAGAKVRILHNHSTSVKSETKRNIVKYILRPFSKLFANNYFACSKLAAKWMYGQELVDNGEVKIINNAIDLNKFAFSNEVRQKKRKELGLNTEFVIGHVGRFMYQKNHAFLLRTFAEILKMRNNSILLLIGIGPLQEEVLELAKKLEIIDHIKFIGLRTDVADLYNAMDVFILPSYYEGLPVVGVETQANGLPILVSTNVTEEAKLSTVIEYKNLSDGAKEWAKKAIDMFDKNDHRINTYDEMTREGFNVIKEAEKLEQFYKEVI